MKINVAKLRKDFDDMSWKELTEKYGVSEPTLRRAMASGKKHYVVNTAKAGNAKKRKAKPRRSKRTSNHSETQVEVHKPDGVIKNYGNGARDGQTFIRLPISTEVHAKWREFVAGLDPDTTREALELALVRTMGDLADPGMAAKRRELFEIGKQTELRRIEVIEA